MRRGLLALAVVALAACCATAVAAPPPVVAPAYIVRGGPDAVVLAARAPDVQRAPASMTKLMTVLVALEHARLSTTSSRCRRRRRGSASRASNLRAGEKLTVRDLAIAALVPSANDAATALAAYVGNGSIPRFVALMNAKANELGLTSTHFENPHGLDQPGHVSSARDMTTLLTAALRNPFIRTWSTRSTATIAGGRTLTSTDDLIGTLPLIGAKTGHTDDAGWSQVAAVAGRRRPHHRVGARLADRGAAECRSRRAPRVGPRPVPPGQGDRRSPRLRSRRDRLRPCRRSGSCPRDEVVRTVRVGKPLVERVVVSSALALPGCPRSAGRRGAGVRWR